jgi:hypothetical protein
MLNFKRSTYAMRLGNIISNAIYRLIVVTIHKGASIKCMCCSFFYFVCAVRRTTGIT